MSYTYKFVQVPRNITIEGPSVITGRQKVDPTQVAAHYLEVVVNQVVADGWEFYRIDSIGVATSPGCLASLLGQKATFDSYNVISFRKPA